MVLRKLIRQDNGFTLIELIVVLAVVAILAAIIIPRYNNVQYAAKVRADAATANGIVGAARIQDISTGVALGGLDDLSTTYFEGAAPTPQSGAASATFTLTKTNAPDKYTVTWTADAAIVGRYSGEYKFTEGDHHPTGTLYND